MPAREETSFSTRKVITRLLCWDVNLGTLTRITTLKLSSLEKILGAVHAAINIGISSQEMEVLAAFLRPALCIDPNKRATAKQLLTHPWLN